MQMYVVAPTCIPSRISSKEFKVIHGLIVRLRCMRPCLQTKKTKKIVPVAVVSLLSFEKVD